ncbi:MAG: ATP-dependent Clp protease ATP-binding subunit, partial [Firmicutes bacterium]|nr:ATP-dependent Clp protease ATP-binding subunit [Candidatus Scybalomonas excrementavium]
MGEQYTAKVKKVIQLAESFAKKAKRNYVGTEHLLVGILKEGNNTAANILIENKVTLENVMQVLESVQEDVISMDSDTVERRKTLIKTPKYEEILFLSMLEAGRDQLLEAGTEHLLISIIKDVENAGCKVLERLNVNVQKIYMDAVKTLGRELSSAKNEYLAKRKQGKVRSATPILDKYSRDLTRLAKDGHLDPVIGRDYEIQRLVQILSRRTKNNPCLTGEPGVGKTAIVEGLAQMLVKGEVPETIAKKRLLSFDLSSMIAGTKYRGEFEERMKRLLEEIRLSGEILLFIDEIHMIIGAGGSEGSVDTANILKPALSRGEIQLIGATTRNEYRKYIEKDSALERRFQPVTVEEPDEEKAIDILNGLKYQYEKHHRIQISEEAVRAAVQLSKRYINDRFLPDKAIDLMDEAASRKRLQVLTPSKNLEKLEQELKQILKNREEALMNGAYEEATEWNQKVEKKEKQIERLKKKYEKERQIEVTVSD